MQYLENVVDSEGGDRDSETKKNGKRQSARICNDQKAEWKSKEIEPEIEPENETQIDGNLSHCCLDSDDLPHSQYHYYSDTKSVHSSVAQNNQKNAVTFT